jgi:hypothetical protein
MIHLSDHKEIFSALNRLSLRTKCLLGVWVIFLLLVASGIHGSSIPATKGFWAPGNAEKSFLFEVLPWRIRKYVYGRPKLENLFLAAPRGIRSDEYIVDAPFALSQLSHDPPFPVINTNFGNGQNMLLMDHTPVWHITLLARPVTWGYFLFGARRGLAWSWWFQAFSCFTVLWLLLEVILRGHSGLAAFGAFWFCGSAFVICYSLWPAYLMFFPCLGCLTLYHWLNSTQPKVQLLCGILAGLSLPGMLMFLYPPWQVVAGQLFLLLFIGLLIRDGLYRKVRTLTRWQVSSLAIAVLLAATLSAAFLVTCWPALRALSQTVYPGARVSTGGGFDWVWLSRGFYNLRTIFWAPAYLGNQTMAASFYYLFPAVLVAVCFSRLWVKRLTTVGWILLLYLAGTLWYMMFGISSTLAKFTLLSHTSGLANEITLGLASIILCVYVLATASETSVDSFWQRRAVPALAAFGMTVLCLELGFFTQAAIPEFPSTGVIILAAFLAGCAAYAMLVGHKQIFCGLVGTAVFLTSFGFNPLSTRLDYLYNGELAQQIKRFNDQAGGRPLWACYDYAHAGMLVALLGGRTLTWVQFYPQLDLWNVLDPDKSQMSAYNRYAHIILKYSGETTPVKFTAPGPDQLHIEASPNDPKLRSLGVRYILAIGEFQQGLAEAHLQPLYRSPSGRFTIFEYPATPTQPQPAAPLAGSAVQHP